MSKDIPFVKEPYFKCSFNYFVSYFSCLCIFIGLVILVFVCVPDDMLNANIIRVSFIASSLFMSIILARITCVCLLEKEDDEIEILNINNGDKDEIVWYN